MNPLASTKCAGRLLMALAAITSIVLMVACGSSSTPAILNSSGFSDSNLSGTYVISISGTDVNAKAGTESFFAIVGTITANGKGGITGTVDINDPDLGSPGVFLAQTVSATSTYSITQDGRGTGTLVTPEGNFGLDFVLTSNGHGLITRFDTAGSGSGTLDVQGSASQSSLTSLAISLSGGVDSSGNPVGAAGAFTLNSSGTITPSGILDVNENGSSIGGLTGLSLTGSLVLGTGASGTAQLNSNFGPLTFDVWVIDSTHLKFIETDTSSGLTLAGDAFTQQTSFTAGQLVYTLGGVDSTLTNPVVAGGYVTTDPQGDLINGIEDYNDNGTVNTLPSFAGTCTTFVAGRCQLTLPAFSNGTSQEFQFAAYPSSGGVQLLEIDGHGLMQGAAFTQTATSFAAPAGYGLNLSGENSNGEVDDIAQFDATSASTNNVTGVLDENDLAAYLNFGVGFTGTYTPDSASDGRGSILIPTTGSIGTLIGGLSLEYYVVDSSTVLFIEGDTDQIAAGTFEAQSSVQPVGGARSHVAIVRPTARPHAALRHK
jgi:hypothetical protein